MYKLFWEGKTDIGMEWNGMGFNLLNTADKLLLLLMAATIMRHFVIIVTSNNTVVRWQRMKMWGHRRQSWKRRPQSKHKPALLIPGACSLPPSHISFLNWSLLFTLIYHSQCKWFPVHILWQSLTPKPCPAVAGRCRRSGSTAMTRWWHGQAGTDTAVLNQRRTCKAFPASAAALPGPEQRPGIPQS